MENVILMEDLKDFVNDTIKGIQQGLALANEDSGITADPEMDVQFTCVLIQGGGFQTLDVVEEGADTGNDTQENTVVDDSKGESTTETTSNGTDNTKGKAITKRSRKDSNNGSNAHTQTSNESGSSHQETT